MEIADGLLPGLYFVIQPSGARSWAVRYRAGGKPRKLTLGPYPALDLGMARARAREALQAAAIGRDPAAEKQASLRAARDGEPDQDTLAAVSGALLGPAHPGEKSKAKRRRRRENVPEDRHPRMGQAPSPGDHAA